MKHASISFFVLLTLGLISSCGSDPSPVHTSEITTLAGTGEAGFVEGDKTVAQFNNLQSVAVDANGNVFVADYNNNRIRKVTSSGTVSTLAGSGTPGFAEGTGGNAQFNFPQGVAVDESGNVYVADQQNHRIRKITSGGVVSTLAGSGTPGFLDETGEAAQFYLPLGVAVDGDGNVFVADGANHRIRKVTAAGVVTTIAGDGTADFANGTGTEAKFNFPQGIAIDNGGNLFVADFSNHRIRKITPAGVVTTFAGDGVSAFLDSPLPGEARFNGPAGIAVDQAGNVYVADYYNSRIRRISAAGVATIAGNETAGFLDGAGTEAQLNSPAGITIGPASGILFVADSKNNRVRKIRP